MALIVSDTGTGVPFTLAAADLAINARPSIRARLKGRSHIFVDPVDGLTKWYDYATGRSHRVTGQIDISSDAGFGGRKVARFSAGAYVTIDDAMPISADYTQIVVFRRSAGGTMALIGSDGDVSSYGTIHTTADGTLQKSQRGEGIYSGTNDGGASLPFDVGHVVAFSYRADTGLLTINADGALYDTKQYKVPQPRSRWYVGRLDAINIPFSGAIAEVIFFAENIVGDALAPIVAHLRADYGI